VVAGNVALARLMCGSTVRVSPLVAVTPRLSVAVTLTAGDPADVGVPVKLPDEFDELRVTPSTVSGVKLRVPVPPVAAIVVVKGTPASAVGKDVVVIIGGGFTVIESDSVADTPLASVIFTVKVDVVAVGASVPVMLDPANERLAGSEPEEMLKALNGCVPPVADSGWEYADP
jgi:hypothetical protein